MKKKIRTQSVGDVAKEEMPLNTGAVIKKPGSAAKYHTGGWRTFKPVIDQNKCIKCSLCWQYCPDVAIYVDKDGKYQINYDYCKGCLICVRECPVKAINKELEQK